MIYLCSLNVNNGYVVGLLVLDAGWWMMATSTRCLCLSQTNIRNRVCEMLEKQSQKSKRGQNMARQIKDMSDAHVM